MERESIIIIGGGISGLVAARLLCSQYDIVLLEALRKFGGRICTTKLKALSTTVEGGAEFIHGNAVETLKLLKVAHLKYTGVGGKVYRKHKNTLLPDEDMMEGWDELLNQMSKLPDDMTLQEFLNKFFPDEIYRQLRVQAITFAEGFDLADPEKVSVKSLYNEWSHQSEDHRVDAGYSALINFLVKDARKQGCKLISGSIVRAVEWQDQNVTVSTIDNQVFKANKCVITIPLGVLQNQNGLTITFKPAIPDYIAGFSKIGFGKVIKVVLIFKTRFWKRDAGYFLSEDVFSAWWAQLPSSAPVLTGWVGGPKAERLQLLSSAIILEEAIKSLADLFQIDEMVLKESLEGWRVFNWQKEKSVMGGYSYSTPETADALKLLNTPIQDTIFFAGEGLYTGDHPGTVEAAIVSAKQAASYLLKR
jgi:monoamine oxidase